MVKLKSSFKENIVEKYKAMGFHTDFILDGNDFNAIDNAITKAKKSNMPSLIEIKTIIGEGSKYENTNIVHGKPLDKEDYLNVKNSLGITEQFFVDQEAKKTFTNSIKERSLKKYNDFIDYYTEDTNN
jgi:transketolase